MIEHRLIERMIKLMAKEVERAKQAGQADLNFIDTAVDFIRTYADRCHHGKEEDILFNILGKKPMSDKDKKMMEELISEHVWGRKTVGSLVDAKNQYAQGNKGSLKDIIKFCEQLIDFYPKHIQKEDKIFFPASSRYFDQLEQEAMLEECYEFDRKLIHEKYSKLVEKLES